MEVKHTKKFVPCKSCGYANPSESPFEFLISWKRNYCRSCNSKLESLSTLDSDWDSDRTIPIKDYAKYMVTIYIIILAVGVCGISLYFLGFELKLDKIVFQVLIEVMAVFFGFKILGIFYYLGKMDNQKREFLQLGGRLQQSIENGVELEKGGKERSLKDVSTMIEAAVKRYDSFERQLDTWIKLTIIMYGIGISLAVFALVLYSFNISHHMIFFTNIIVLIVIFVSFNKVWNQIRVSLRKIETLSINLHSFHVGSK
ncbi:MAG: hypothetical protein ACR2IS_03130, partial [Nitrososphaeraceae archaeon]